jgi:lipopolysaccharide assembly outer membrane protein LptD (OstA)
MQGRYTAGGVLTAEQRDPRHPEVFLWKLSATGMQVDHPGQAITGVMTGVSATLYQKGKPAAILRAPRAYGDNVQKQITATGGVVVNSISQAGRPDGRKLTADNAVWKAKTATQPDQLIARGHVVYTDSVTGTTIRCAELITDTRLKTVSASNGATDLAGAILKRKQ